jgi:DUF4097 and DUF4098 domain-containing protein YvlB
MRLAFTFLALVCLVVPAHAQLRDNRDRSLSCNGDTNFNNRRARTCEVTEATLGPSGMLDVEPGRNGGVTVKGWSQNSVVVRARVEAWAESDSEARSIASQIRVDASGGRVRATGPEWNNDNDGRNQYRSWSVSFEIFAPWNTDLKLASHNGGVSISDIKGRIQAESHNGGLQLTRIAGDVAAETHNGGIQANLEGNSWDGRQLALSTHNGGIMLSLPSSYSARFETQSNRGRLDSDFPVNVRGRIDDSNLDFTLGAGGPTIKVSTHNGGIRLRRN